MGNKEIERLSSIILSPSPIYSHADLNRRIDAIDELASMGTQALATLSKAIHHSHPNIRENAVLGLGKVGGNQALKILKDLLDNPESNLVFCAVEALGEIGGDEVTRVLSEFIKREDLSSTTAGKALEILAQKGGKEGAEAVIEACSQNYPSYIRLAAIEQLPNLSTSRLPEILEKILQDKDWVILEEANRALKKIGSPWANEMIERHKKKTTEIKQEWGKKVQEKRQKQVTQAITCADCKKDFTWNDAYNQQNTPGSHLHNPPGHGDFRPRAFCPHCGFLVVEWDIDRSEDRNQWKWHGENASLNKGRELPPSPITYWGHPLHLEAQVTVEQDHIDIKLVRRLEGKAPSAREHIQEKPKKRWWPFSKR